MIAASVARDPSVATVVIAPLSRLMSKHAYEIECPGGSHRFALHVPTCSVLCLGVRCVRVWKQNFHSRVPRYNYRHTGYVTEQAQVAGQQDGRLRAQTPLVTQL